MEINPNAFVGVITNNHRYFGDYLLYLFPISCVSIWLIPPTRRAMRGWLFKNNSGVAKVTQENSYYGYGLLMPGSLVGFSAPPNKNLYNGGSEWQNDTKAVNAGVPDYYQTFYRNYDPALARFIAVDPMAEGASDMSVFQYAGDNPVMNSDPGGDLAKVKTSQPSPQGFSGDPGFADGLGSNMGNGGGGGTDPANAIGRSSDSNWMNDGEFDDEGGGIDPTTSTTYKGGLSFSNDGGAAGRAFWLPSEMSGGALAHITPQLANQLIANLPGLGAGAIGAYVQNSVTALRQVEIISGQKSYVKDGVVYIQATYTTGDYIDDDASQGGIFNTSNGSFRYTFSPTTYPDADGTILNGANFRVFYNTSGKKYNSYQWVQTINQWVNGKYSYKEDGLNLPFYFASTDQEANYAQAYNSTAYFEDSPATNAPSRSFFAETTLVGIGGNGQLTPLGTLSWGYWSPSPGQTYLLGPFFSPSPSTVQQAIIKSH